MFRRFIHDRFPFGSHLCRDPMPPMAELKRDIALLAGNGFNLVKLQVNWATTEPRDGCLDLDRFEELIAEAERFDLGVYLGYVCEHAPHWLWRKHPACRMVGRNGLPVAYEAVATLPADGKPGPCFDHAGARTDMLDYLRRATAVLGAHPNIAIWSTWQEIGYWAEGDWLVGQSVCFCENTLAAFRDHVRKRFADDLAALNAAWRTNHGDWLDIMPTRTQRGRDTHPVDMAWHDFMHNEQVARVLSCRAETIRAADPGQRPVFAHKGAPAIGMGADRRYAVCQGFLAHSTYPSWSPFYGWDDGGSSQVPRIDRAMALVAEAWGGMALCADHLRSANPSGRTWAAELQGGPVSQVLHKGRIPSAADIRRWVLTGVAHGQCGISFWVTRAEVAAAELNGFSLLDSIGDSNERFAEAGRIGRALDRHPDLFAAPTLPRPDLAVIVDDANARFHQVLICASEHLTYSVRGWHRLAFDLAVPMDFLFAEDFAERAAGYRVLVLPFPLLLGEDLASRLDAWVEAGGTLIAECCPGRVDENAFATRGEISSVAQRLFGVEQESFQLVREPGDAKRWTFAERTWGEFAEAQDLIGAGDIAGERLTAHFVLTTFCCRDAQPLFTSADGRVAGTLHRHGRGRAILIGSVVGHGGTAHRVPAHHAAVARLLSLGGATPRVIGGCVLRKRVTSVKEAWFLWNPDASPRAVTLDVVGFRAVEDLFGVVLERAGDQVSLEIPGLDVRCLVLGR